MAAKCFSQQFNVVLYTHFVLREQRVERVCFLFQMLPNTHNQWPTKETEVLFRVQD